jgi:hypothetical protein
MKIRIILIAAILAVSLFAQGQVSKATFDKAVDFLNCKVVGVSLQSDKNLYQQYMQICPCGDDISYPQIQGFLTSVGVVDKTVAVSTEIENLKTTYKEGLKKDEAVIFLSETIFTDHTKYQKLFQFAEKRKTDASFATFKKALKTDLQNELAMLENENSETTNNSANSLGKNASLEERVLELEQLKINSDEGEGWFTKNINIFVIISLTLSIFLSIIAIVHVTNGGFVGGEKVTEGIRKYVNDKISEASFIKIKSNSNTISNVDLEHIINELKRVELIAVSKNTPMEIVYPKQDSYSQDTKQLEIKSDFFYLSTPNADGSFNDSSASLNYKEGASIYKFTKIENSRAKFQIDERETSIKFALTYPDKSIIPVCDSVNEYESKYTHIRTLIQGEAELQNGKWIVNKNQKAKIRYEN